MNIIEQMLSNYEITTEADLINALKEIFQEIALLGLYQGGFLKKLLFMEVQLLEYFMDFLDFQKI